MPPTACRRRSQAAGTLLLLGLLLLAGGARLAAAQGDSPSPSPSPSGDGSSSSTATSNTDTATTGSTADDAEAPAPSAAIDFAPAPSPAGADLLPGDLLPGEAAGPVPAPTQQSARVYGDNREGKPLLTPSQTELEGRTFYYEIPNNPKGLLVLFHGCYHSAYDFWPEQDDCPECRGECWSPCAHPGGPTCVSITHCRGPAVTLDAAGRLAGQLRCMQVWSAMQLPARQKPFRKCPLALYNSPSRTQLCASGTLREASSTCVWQRLPWLLTPAPCPAA
jgi:hypothetical protein